MEKTALKVIFSGRVQGVGFRYNVLSLAGGYRISGYVRNLRDGTVELFAQGDESETEAFINAVCRRMDRYIQDQYRTIVPVEPAIKDFRIKY
ncbi:Acylphosphatase [Limihaloglobus sulfuriphilus]|uniref:acylphosphatase n=1 Tax=Limihaloglobus sulfuriphilus TaxID=1851148 RepID=A0A1Q2MBD5_9BACT|nr:acylphosphatase [Limihaloglobus sulfuriphilus]AQQ70033.1 Acylphosphatase [Limihaloglobus sulfuriphilus]